MHKCSNFWLWVKVEIKIQLITIIAQGNSFQILSISNLVFGAKVKDLLVCHHNLFSVVTSSFRCFSLLTTLLNLAFGFPSAVGKERGKVFIRGLNPLCGFWFIYLATIQQSQPTKLHENLWHCDTVGYNLLIQRKAVGSVVTPQSPHRLYFRYNCLRSASRHDTDSDTACSHSPHTI